MDPFGVLFGRLVREKRGIEGLSQDGLAEKSGQARTVDALCVALNIASAKSTPRSGTSSCPRRWPISTWPLRASPLRTFTKVILPLSLPSILAGVALSAARALGEFGATIVFAGNLPGRTQTMPLAVYMALQNDVEAAAALSVLLVAVSFALLAALRLVR
jgi:ABC-type molybdate transport system permease subunit